MCCAGGAQIVLSPDGQPQCGEIVTLGQVRCVSILVDEQAIVLEGEKQGACGFFGGSYDCRDKGVFIT